MNICVLGINYAPELTGIAVYTADMCEYFAQKGHDVVMLTGFPYYPQWDIDKKYRGALYLNEEINSVLVKRCYLYVPKVITAFKRIVHESSFILSSFFRGLFMSNPDVIIVVSPPLGLGVTGYLLSKIKRVPLVFHVQDLQPDAAVGLGMLKEGSLTKFFYAVEKFIYRKANLITTISKSMQRKIVNKGININKTQLVPNWSTLDICQNDHSWDFKKEFDLEGKFVFLYAGNVGKKQGLEILIDAFAKIEEKEAVCLIVGNGANINFLQDRVKKYGLKNIKFLPLQPAKRLLPMLRAADVCLVIQKKVVSDIVFPSKMTNIMAAGCVSLVTADLDTELAKAVIDSNSGYIAKPEDVTSLKETILYCLQDNDISMKRNSAAQYANEHLDKKRILDNLIVSLINLISNP